MSATIHPPTPEFRSQAIANDQASQTPSTAPGSDLDAAGDDDGLDPIADAVSAGVPLTEVLRVAGYRPGTLPAHITADVVAVDLLAYRSARCGECGGRLDLSPWSNDREYRVIGYCRDCGGESEF